MTAKVIPPLKERGFFRSLDKIRMLKSTFFLSCLMKDSQTISLQADIEYVLHQHSLITRLTKYPHLDKYLFGIFVVAFSVFYINTHRSSPIVFGLLPLYIAIMNHGRRGFRWFFGLFLPFSFGLFWLVEHELTFDIFRMWGIWTLFFLVIGHVLVQWQSLFRTIMRLLTALQLRTKTLHSICCQCKQIRHNDKWIPIERILQQQGFKVLSHGYCTTCYQEFLEEHGIDEKEELENL